MKRISFLIATLALCATSPVRAQDAATEERLNKLSGQIESLIETQQELSKRIGALAKEMDNLREQAGKPTGNYAGQQDVELLKEKIKEVDRKRMDDAEKVRAELLNIRNAVLKGQGTRPSGKTAKAPSGEKADPEKPAKPESGFEYTIKSGDTLLAIVQAYKEKNIKITVDQILQANPGLKANSLVVGKTIFIPAPKQ